MEAALARRCHLPWYGGRTVAGMFSCGLNLLQTFQGPVNRKKHALLLIPNVNTA